MSSHAWHDGAMSLPAQNVSTGRLARGPFLLAIGMVYLASFVSQMLLSAPVTGRLSVLPFIVAQAVLIWLWIELHRRRLRDAGRPTGIVFGIAMIYVLEVVLLVLLVWLVFVSPATSGGASTESSIFQLFVLLYLLGSLSGDPTFGALQVWLFGFVAVMLLPVAIALVFSVWAATRPSAASPP